jgi:hypothetical protein
MNAKSKKKFTQDIKITLAKPADRPKAADKPKTSSPKTTMKTKKSANGK